MLFIDLKLPPSKENPSAKRPGHVDNIAIVPLPLQIEKEYKNISLLMDYIFINSQPYFLTE